MFAYTKIMQALAAAGVVPAATDPYFNLTTLLLNTTSTNGAQNNTFLDSSTNNFTITRNGNTTQGTFTPFSQTGWSNYFGGSSDYFNLGGQTAFAFGSGDFTIETWFFVNSTSAVQFLFDFRPASTDGLYPMVYISSGGGSIIYEQSNAARITGTTTVSVGTWYHFALARSGTSTKMFLNGTQIGSTYTDNNSYLVGANRPAIASSGFTLGNLPLNGYLSNFRIVKGTAVYTSAFTPSTTPLTAITNTSLLTCQSNRFLDNSTNAFAITANGAPSVQAFSPFLPTAAYDTAVVGGSGYFDGTGDYLAVPSSSAFSITGDFTYEGWVYVTSTSTNRFITPSTVSIIFDVVSATGNNMKLQFYDGGSAFVDSVNTFPINTWTHIAVVRSGTSTNNCSFYVNGVRGTQFTTNATNSSPSIDIGRYSAGGNFYGYIGGLRIVKGQAVYSGATYTIPNAPLTTTGYGSTSQSITASNTSLLLNFTNAGIYDSASKNVLETVGNAQVSTTQAKWGTTSMYFDGTGDYLVNYNNVAIGTANCTIEAWIYPVFTGSGLYGAFCTGPGGTTSNLRFGVYTNQLYLDISGATVFASTGATISANTWTHIAVTRNNGTWYGFINGTQMGSTTTQGTTSVTGTERFVGVLGTTGGGNAWNGYIDDLRVTQGYARYTASFTPPTAAFPVQ